MTGEDIKIIIGAEPETTIKDFLDNIDNDNDYLVVYNKDDEIVSADDYEDTLITTGARVKLVINGTEYDEVRVIIRGDVNQDGQINVMDNAMLTNHILEKTPIEGYQLYAADVVEEDVELEYMIDVKDQGQIIKYIVEKIDTLNGKDGD